MGIKVSITCDSCGHDLKESTNSIDYRICLKSERMPSCDGVVTDMMIYPDFDEPLYFCGRGCMKEWLKENL